MGRLIDADALYNGIDELRLDAQELFDGGSRDIGYQQIQNMLDDAPTVDAVPVVHAHWIPMFDYPGCFTFTCSRCSRKICRRTEETLKDYPYCHCGAKMDGEQKKAPLEEDDPNFIPGLVAE